MPISPWFQGDRKPVWDFGLSPDSGTLDITGLSTSDFTLVLINTTNRVPTTGTGVFSNLQAASGSTPAMIQYAPSAADVGTPGSYELRVVIDVGTVNQRTFEMGIWQCQP